jgi:Spy/CpxP family protein refolding chaperone
MNYKIMKKLIYILFVSWICIPIQAQDMEEAQPQDASVRDKIKTARIGLITQRLNLTPEQAQKFWPLYNEFDQKRAEIRKPLKEAKRSIDPNNSDPKQQQALVDLGFKIKQDELNLEKEYSNKMTGVITAQQMLNLRQAEHDFRKIIINMLNNRRLQQQRKENFRDRNMRLREKRK